MLGVPWREAEKSFHQTVSSRALDDAVTAFEGPRAGYTKCSVGGQIDLENLRQAALRARECGIKISDRVKQLLQPNRQTASNNTQEAAMLRKLVALHAKAAHARQKEAWAKWPLDTGCGLGIIVGAVIGAAQSYWTSPGG